MKIDGLIRGLTVYATIMLLTNQSFAGETLVSIKQLLDQAETLSPMVKKARANLDITEQEITQAKVIPNPEIVFGNFAGRAGSRKWGQTDITLLQPIELGGKRSSRVGVAESLIKGGRAEFDLAVAEVRLNTLSLLYRIRQIKDEISLLKEAQTTFSKLVGNYRKRPQLSPEQSTSLFLFQLAFKDYELQEENVLSEMNLLEAELKQLTGHSIAEISHLLPIRKKAWPQIPNSNQLESPYLRVLRAQTDVAEQQLRLAKADAWPTLNIGPSFTSQNQFGEKANIWGLSLSFPLPVLNQNNGAKAIATASMVSGQKRYEIEKSVQETKREALRANYQSSVEVLLTQTSDVDLHRKHEEIESFFLKGLISSPLVIEAHRQMFENKKLFHQRELVTLESYYQVVLLDGGKVEEF